MGKKLVVNPVTRIEGHAKIILDLDDQDQVLQGHLQVIEIRGFEKLLEGMELFKMPLITARLCGVCPAAHHLAAVAAIEAGLGIQVPKDAELLRELLYAGHMLHSHALSCFVLAGPDLLLGIDADPKTRNIFGLLQMAPDTAKKALRLRSIGQRVVEMVGGRGIHPVTAIPGGMASGPTDKDLATMAEWGGEALSLIEELGGVIREKLAGMEPLREQMPLTTPALSLCDQGAHSFIKGDFVLGDTAGQKQTIPVADYHNHLVEHVMPSSYMKAVRLRGTPEQSYHVGPLARLQVNDKINSPKAQQALNAFRSARASNSSALDYVEARLVEMIHATERIASIAGGEVGRGPLLVAAEAKAGRFIGAVEAPRGILIHDYTTDQGGKVLQANLIVATQNNYDAIDTTITNIAKHYLPQGNNHLLLNGMEFALRCFDPCLSCATHVFGRMPLEVELHRQGATVETFSRSSLA